LAQESIKLLHTAPRRTMAAMFSPVESDDGELGDARDLPMVAAEAVAAGTATSSAPWRLQHSLRLALGIAAALALTAAAGAAGSWSGSHTAPASMAVEATISAAAAPAEPVSRCSDMGKDCLDSKCCTSIGSVCYHKDPVNTTCQSKCDASKGLCQEIGPRVCTWPGENCGHSPNGAWVESPCCNIAGQKCYEKNAFDQDNPWNPAVAECRDSCTPGPNPWEWSCKVLGEARPPTKNLKDLKAPYTPAGTSLFCFTVVTPNGLEADLVKAQQEAAGGIFACDASKVLSLTITSTVNSVTAEVLGHYLETDKMLFLKAWDQIKASGQYKDHDFTVKVQPDVVFFPLRLKSQLTALGAPAKTSFILQGKDGLVGDVMVFSNPAVKDFYWHTPECALHFANAASEGAFFSSCFEALGIDHMVDDDLFSDATCTEATAAALLPASIPSMTAAFWTQCYQQGDSGQLSVQSDDV